MNVNLAVVISRADRQWCQRHGYEPMPPPQLDAIARAVEAQVGTAAVDELRAELANARGLLARLVEAVTDRWDPKGDAAAQASEALRQLRQVRAYLEGLQQTREAA